MNLYELDKYLRTITEHELEYKNGHIVHTFENIPRKNIDGKNVLYFNLNELVPVQQRKSLYIKKHSRFQTFPEHVHADVEFNYMYSGSCRQIINGKSYDLTEGEVLLLNSDTVHTIEPLRENDILINLNIQKEYLNLSFFNRFSHQSVLTSFFLNSITEGVTHNNFIIFNSAHNERLKIMFSEFMIESLNPSVVSDDILNSLLTIIISEIINAYKKDFNKQNTHEKNNQVIQILNYLDDHYKTCSLKDVAAHFNLNQNYLSNLLKKTTRFSYKQIIQTLKLNHAASILKDPSFSITEVANISGYENVSFFYKKFYAHFKCTPHEYRTKINSNPII